MIFSALLYAGLFALCAATGLALLQWQRAGSADRILIVLLNLTVFQEGISFWTVWIMHKNNMITYHIYSPLELLLLCLWMSRSHPWRRARASALVCGLIGCLASIANSAFLQSTNTPNTYFLLIEGAVIIQLSLTSIAGLVMRESVDPYKLMHFWVALNLIFYWSITLVAYGMIGLTSKDALTMHYSARLLLLLANIIFYTALGVTFLRYKKLIPSGA